MSDDLVKRLRAAAKHPMMDNNCKADVFDVADAADRIEELEAAIKRQAGAARTLRQLTLAEVQHLSDMDRSEYFAAQTLNSERDANAILTDRIEELEGQLQSVLDRETSILRYYDAKLDAADAKLTREVEGLTEIAAQPDYRLPQPQDIARTTLVELKGEQP